MSTDLKFIRFEELLNFLLVVIRHETSAVFRLFEIKNLSCSPSDEDGFEHLKSLSLESLSEWDSLRPSHMSLPDLLNLDSAIGDVTIEHELPLLFDRKMSHSHGLDEIPELEMSLRFSDECKESIQVFEVFVFPHQVTPDVLLNDLCAVVGVKWHPTLD